MQKKVQDSVPTIEEEMSVSFIKGGYYLSSSRFESIAEYTPLSNASIQVEENPGWHSYWSDTNRQMAIDTTGTLHYGDVKLAWRGYQQPELVTAVYCAIGATDMRKSIDALVALVQMRFKCSSSDVVWIVTEHQTSKAVKGPEAFLRGFEGYLHMDGANDSFDPGTL